jgi:hypothetical protein
MEMRMTAVGRINIRKTLDALKRAEEGVAGSGPGRTGLPVPRPGTPRQW